jgi:hypothetical protein
LTPDEWWNSCEESNIKENKMSKPSNARIEKKKLREKENHKKLLKRKLDLQQNAKKEKEVFYFLLTITDFYGNIIKGE